MSNGYRCLLVLLVMTVNTKPKSARPPIFKRCPISANICEKTLRSLGSHDPSCKLSLLSCLFFLICGVAGSFPGEWICSLARDRSAGNIPCVGIIMYDTLLICFISRSRFLCESKLTSLIVVDASGLGARNLPHLDVQYYSHGQCKTSSKS